MFLAGTLKDFGFDSDEEREHLAINGGDKAAADTTEKVKHEEGADNGEQPKKKEKATKAPVRIPPFPSLAFYFRVLSLEI